MADTSIPKSNIPSTTSQMKTLEKITTPTLPSSVQIAAEISKATGALKNFDDLRAQALRTIRELAGSSSEILIGLLGGFISLLICLLAMAVTNKLYTWPTLQAGLIPSISFFIGATLSIVTYRGEIRRVEKMLKANDVRLLYYQEKIAVIRGMSNIQEEVAALKASNAPDYMIEQAWRNEHARRSQQAALEADLGNEVYISAHLGMPKEPLKVDLRAIPQNEVPSRDWPRKEPSTDPRIFLPRSEHDNTGPRTLLSHSEDNGINPRTLPPPLDEDDLGK